MESPTFTPYEYAEPAEVQPTGEVVRRVNAYGQIVEYHQVIHKRTNNHIAVVKSAGELQSKMNTEMVTRGIDGWCDGVVVIQRILTDDVHFYGYMAATEEMSPFLGIPIWALVAFIVAAAAVVAFGMWLVYSFFSAALEKAIPTTIYVTEKGERATSLTELVTLQRKYFWLVCPKCGMGFASKTDYPTWEDIPQEIHDAYEEHVAACAGIPKEEDYPWVVPVLIIGAVVVVVGTVWAIGQAFVKREAPIILR